MRMQEYYTPKIQSVTDITKSIKVLLETGFSFVTVVGEISNLRIPHSGHMYFTLKDQESQLKAVLFKPQQRYLTHKPGDGQEVICRGRISVYEPRGEYQLIVDVMDPKGVGELQIAFELLKKKLAEEGLFDESHKKSLPFFPQKITLITSPSGAAVADFLKTAEKRFPGLAIEIFPVRVQGDGAADDITVALEIVNERKSSDVIVLCRGGGSIEDLWPFNEEKVARTIYASAIPVVSAIGHEIDYTITDFVADFRASTPTAAAETVVPDKNGLSLKIAQVATRLQQAMRVAINDHRLRLQLHRRMLGDPTLTLSNFHLRLDHRMNEMMHTLFRDIRRKKAAVEKLQALLYQHSPQSRLTQLRQRSGEHSKRLQRTGNLIIERKVAKLRRITSLLEAVSPLAVLARGYSITRLAKSGEIIRSAKQVEKGDAVDIMLHEGEISAGVTGKKINE